MVDTEKLDKAILALLRNGNGVEEWNINRWRVELHKEFHLLPDWDELVSAMKRLRADGIIHLKKCCKEYPSEHTGDADDWWFFGHYAFRVSITDEGRKFWNVSVAPIGFQMSGSSR